PRSGHKAFDARHRAAWRPASSAGAAPAKFLRAEVRRGASAASRAWEASWSSHLSLMIIFQIHVDGIAFEPSKCDPPISAGADRIAVSVAPGERMKAKP